MKKMECQQKILKIGMKDYDLSVLKVIQYEQISDIGEGYLSTKIDNKTYFFETEKTADEGKMVTGWKKIQDAWYYFEADGAMLANATSPDGYVLGADGKMMTV